MTKEEWERMADDAWSILTAPADQRQRLRDKVDAQLRERNDHASE